MPAAVAVSEQSAWRSQRSPYGAGDVIAVLVWTVAIAAFFWDAVSLQRALFYFDITEIRLATIEANCAGGAEDIIGKGSDF